MPQKSDPTKEQNNKSAKPAAKKTAPKAAAVKPAAKKSKAPAPATGTPMIDTGLAAAAAARFLVAKLPSKPESGTTPRGESSMFKQLKGGMAKPAGQAMSNLLDRQGGPMQKSSNDSFGSGGQQVGKNQTFGADVNRAGVPRRTGGG